MVRLIPNPTTPRTAPARRWLATCLLAVSLSAGLGAAEQRFTTSATLSTEAQTLVQLLETAHYNRTPSHSDDYAQVIPDYMTALDGQHLFFLGSDRDDFVSRFGKNVYYNVDYLGNIDSAYEIFDVYDERVTSRVGWIFGELKKDFDFTANDTSGSTAPSRRGRRQGRGGRTLAKAAQVRDAGGAPQQEDLRAGQGGRAQALRAHAEERRRDRGQRPVPRCSSPRSPGCTTPTRPTCPPTPARTSASR